MPDETKDALVDDGEEIIMRKRPAELKRFLRENYADMSGGSDSPDGTVGGGWHVRLHQSSIVMTVEDYIKGDI